jgi:hypothetical protein
MAPEWAKKVLRFLEQISIGVVILAPILAVISITDRWWEFLNFIIPMPVYITFRNYFAVAIAFCSVLFVFALFVLGVTFPFRKHYLARSAFLVVGILISIPLCFSISILALSPVYLTSSASIYDSHYYVTAATTVGDMWINNSLYKCNEKGLHCKVAYEEANGGSYVVPSSLVMNDDSQEIYLFLNGTLSYSDGPISHDYHYLQVEFVDESKFDLYTYENHDEQEFVITKCDGKSLNLKLSCNVLPFHYSTQRFEKATLVADDKKREIRLIIDGNAVLSFDTSPHCYVEDCHIPEK